MPPFRHGNVLTASPASLRLLPPFRRSPLEFCAYRVLYALYTGNTSDSRTLLRRLTPEQAANEWVRHAVAALAAHTSENWTRFFRLYRTAPNMASYLLDWTLHTTRIRALQTLTKA